MSRQTPVVGFDHSKASLRTVDGYNAYASNASLRTPLYGGLGTIVDEAVSKDTAAMLKAAGLDWEVRLEDIELKAKTDKKYHEVIRNGYGPNGDEDFGLGVVGQGYKLLQNAKAFSFVDGIVHGGGYWDVAGHYNHGRTVFGVLKFDKSIFLDPNGANDEIEDTMVFSTSHNGTGALSVGNAALRIRCMNAVTNSIRGAKRTYKVRHTTNLEGKMAVAREALGLNRLYMDKFSEMANEMIAMELAPSAPERIFAKLNPKPEDNTKGALTKWEGKYEQFTGILNSETLANFPSTNAWKVYMALEEQKEWFSAPRLGNTERVLASGAGFIEADNKIKDNMRDVVFAYGKANRKVRV